MKKITFILLIFFTVSTYSQYKITYKQYDQLKYIKTLLPKYTFNENLNTTGSISQITNISETYKSDTFFALDGLLIVCNITDLSTKKLIYKAFYNTQTDILEVIDNDALISPLEIYKGTKQIY